MINARSVSAMTPADQAMSGASLPPGSQAPLHMQNQQYTHDAASPVRKRVLAPESSSPEYAVGPSVSNGNLATGPSRMYYNPPPRPAMPVVGNQPGIDGGYDRRYMVGPTPELGDFNGQSSSRDGSAPPPKKRLLRESDLARSVESSAGASPAATPLTPSNLSATPSPIMTPPRYPGSAQPQAAMHQASKPYSIDPRNIPQPQYPNGSMPNTVPSPSALDSSPPITRPPLSRLQKGPRPLTADDESSPPRGPTPITTTTPTTMSRQAPMPVTNSQAATYETIRRYHQMYFPMLEFRVVYETVVGCRGDLRAAMQVLRQRFKLTIPGQPQPQVSPGRPIYQQNGAPYAPVMHPTFRNQGYMMQPHQGQHIAYARSAPQPVPRPVPAPKPKKRKVYDSDTEDEYGSDASAEDYVDKEDQLRKEMRGLAFFNEGNVSDLPDLTGKVFSVTCGYWTIVINVDGISACTPKQAEVIVSMRPFESVEDLRTKLRKRKGVSAGLFDSYLDIMDVSVLAT
jgi:hypothetical protein